MRCPKCQHENPDGTLFCEECDHRTDQPYRKERTTIPPGFAAAVAAVLGAVSLLLCFMVKDIWYAAVIAGAFGLFLGAYSMTVARTLMKKNSNMILIIAVAGMLLSMIGFMLGLSNY